MLKSKPNQIRNLTPVERKIVDARVAVRGLGKARRALKANDASSITKINALDGLGLLGKRSRNNKYVLFNDHVYMDVFAPKWPGRAFDQFTDAFIRNLVEAEGGLVSFIPSLVFAVTRRCVYRCEHCYAIQMLGSKDVVPVEKLLQIARDFQKIGVGVMSWEGGEPLLRFEDLLYLIRETSDQSESLIATTAHGLTKEKAERLKEAGLVTAIISLDHYDPERHNAFRGNKKSFDMAVDGVRLFRENGILPSVAVCATRELMEEEGLFRYLELAKQIGAAFIQILDATPSGNYIGKDVALTDKQLETIKRFHITVNTDPRYRDYPGIQARALLEDDDSFGCCAANALVYVDSAGHVQACDLLQIAFGNVVEEPVQEVYDRLREYFPHPFRGRCPAQTLHKDIESVYQAHGSLPLPYKNCEHILKQIRDRGLPDVIETIQQKRERTRWREIFFPRYRNS